MADNVRRGIMAIGIALLIFIILRVVFWVLGLLLVLAVVSGVVFWVYTKLKHSKPTKDADNIIEMEFEELD
ncbi:hypothetical protein KG089_04895 [Carnobacteriaceae bacterium zg-ZUI252]|nr:hypothetical protein [Carnobacteriaceae bacterium zg-ZUI252]MBS4770150.1 hypothetical protein [Carnobacteriaceae bacterium zg-ZUI240]